MSNMSHHHSIIFKENAMNNMIKIPRNLAVAVAMLFGVSAATGAYAEEPASKSKMDEKSKSASKSKSSKSAGKEGDIIIEIPVLMLVPVDVSDTMKNKGCWVRLYDGKDYQGDSFTITGPINLPKMVGPFGFNWDNKVRSLETGPKANLTIFNTWNFQNEDKFIDANSRVPNLSKEMGFFDNFRSMMLSCI